MKKLFTFSFLAIMLSFAAKATITGNTNICLGSAGFVTDSLNPGGVWSSSNTGVATIDATGTVYGVSIGSTVLSYVYGAAPGTLETVTFTVNAAAPSAITGPTSVCAGSSISLGSTPSGGNWTSSNTTVATVDASGNVYGVSSGWTTIGYHIGSSPCAAYLSVSVITGSGGSLAGPSTVCAAGGTITLTDSAGTGGGAWTSSNNALATVSASGVVTGVAVGTVTITYTFTGPCGSVSHVKTINVINTTSAGTISGASSVYVGGTGSLNATVSGGVWSSSNAAIAAVSSSGVVSGVAVGTVTITYTVTGCGGTAYTTYTVAVIAANSISGDVLFSSGSAYGPLKIWLITYNTATMDLEAVDSISTYVSGTSKHYQFLNVPTDAYRVKAAVYDSFTTTTGYIPTYHTSSFYWNSATVINHTSGVDDIGKDITMMIGTPTTGPGFIGGNVTTGANKGTTDGAPVEGLSMNLLDASNQLIQTIRTDASGAYSFSNLPIGTYYVFPDSLNYLTTAYTGITLTASATSMSVASFVQHTISGTITPIVTGVNTVSNLASIIAFPNPASNKLTLQWTATAADKGTMTITDITGRQVYSTDLSFAAGTGVKTVDLSSFTNGLYLVSVKSASATYNTKIQVQH